MDACEGSNVQGIETTITYDKSTREFVIHTPSDMAQKIWIGGLCTSAIHPPLSSLCIAHGLISMGSVWVGGCLRG